MLLSAAVREWKRAAEDVLKARKGSLNSSFLVNGSSVWWTAAGVYSDQL